MTGLRVELEINSPDACPVAAATADAGAPAKQIAWSENGDGTVEQFALETGGAELSGRISSIFEYENEGVYQFVREHKQCPCERIEAAGQPVADVRADGGLLYVTLHLGDRDALGVTMDTLREAYEDVTIKTIARTDTGSTDEAELVPVNRGQLTDRQREVLETAYAMGYFDYPRGANAGEVADALGICASTLTEHIAAAQSKVLSDLLGERSDIET